MKFSSDKTVNLLTFLAALLAVVITFSLMNVVSGRYYTAASAGILAVNYVLAIRLGIMLQANMMRDAAELSAGAVMVETVIDSDLVSPGLSEPAGWEGFDPDSAEYPEELDIALQAWRAVSNNKSHRPIKEQLESWVRINYPAIKSNSAIDRIATVSNWSTGGRPKKDENS